MGIGLNSPANKRKSAPRGTFTLHKNSVEEETPVASFQEYPKFIAEDVELARDAVHEAQLRASLAPADEKPKKAKKEDAA